MEFEKSNQLVSSLAPISYSADNFLVLYCSYADSKFRTPVKAEISHGDRLEQVLKNLQQSR
ncbi:hypothetical protein C2I18_29185 [Paenibacillus sp. PK3_47]|nr:hypothetical protein C2I18_29185 [Paenibacillus sp. PK3_47]